VTGNGGGYSKANSPHVCMLLVFSTKYRFFVTYCP